MKKVNLVLILFLALVFTERGLSEDKIALTLKARGRTSLKRAQDTNFKTGLAVGTPLFSKDHIKTGDDGYVVMVFLDDKSQIKIRENSEMMISGERKPESISKKILMQFGTLKAEVTPMRKGEFTIATPTSVASVKGTVFWVLSDPIQGDTFYGISGTVEVTNNKSGQTILVGANQTGKSSPSGDMNVEMTKPGDIPEDEKEPEGESIKSLRIQFQNANGETKNLKIDYK